MADDRPVMAVCKAKYCGNLGEMGGRKKLIKQ